MLLYCSAVLLCLWGSLSTQADPERDQSLECDGLCFFLQSLTAKGARTDAKKASDQLGFIMQGEG
jgi:hypothetical protein